MTKSYGFTQSRLLAGWAVLAVAAGVAAGPGAESDEYESRWFRNVRQLTSKEMGLERSGEAYFSPDGRRICFQAYPAGKTEYQIYVMNLDGSGLKMVSTGIGATTCSYFHPSGERMIFAANHEDLREPEKPEEIEAYRSRGERPADQPGHPGGRPPAHPGGAAGGHPGSRPGAAGGHPGGSPPAQADRAPGGHPGGTAGAHHQGGRGPAWKYFPGMEIYEYTFATGELKRLTHSDGYDAECAYSPDGKQIVFASFRDGDREIYICDADGQNPRRITHAKGGDGGPFFSPDGKQIVYRSERDDSGNLKIFVNNVEGTAERALTGSEVFNWCPFWHPSGKWIVFTRVDFRGRPNFDLYLLRADGSEIYRVTTDSVFDGLPVFSPDGRYLMWTSKRNGVDAPQIFIADFVGLTPDGELRAEVEPVKSAPRP